MELKHLNKTNRRWQEGSINRTFMELKLLSIKALKLFNACINRTFMELKRRKNAPETLLLEVLIEPLWN